MVTKLQKEDRIKELRTLLEKAKLTVISDYRGVTVKEITDVRRRMQKFGAEYTVAKNTLTKIAAKDLPIKDLLEPFLKGPTALIISPEDPVGPAKALLEFMKESKKTEIRGGILEGKVITPENIKDIAALPPKEVLLAKLMGSLNAPASGLVGALSGVSRNLVNVLDQIRKQKEENN